jgi:hypothetical protein
MPSPRRRPPSSTGASGGGTSNHARGGGDDRRRDHQHGSNSGSNGSNRTARSLGLGVEVLGLWLPLDALERALQEEPLVPVMVSLTADASSPAPSSSSASSPSLLGFKRASESVWLPLPLTHFLPFAALLRRWIGLYPLNPGAIPAAAPAASRPVRLGGAGSAAAAGTATSAGATGEQRSRSRGRIHTPTEVSNSLIQPHTITKLYISIQ